MADATPSASKASDAPALGSARAALEVPAASDPRESTDTRMPLDSPVPDVAEPRDSYKPSRFQWHSYRSDDGEADVLPPDIVFPKIVIPGMEPEADNAPLRRPPAEIDTQKPRKLGRETDTYLRPPSAVLPHRPRMPRSSSLDTPSVPAAGPGQPSGTVSFKDTVEVQQWSPLFMGMDTREIDLEPLSSQAASPVHNQMLHQSLPPRFASTPSGEASVQRSLRTNFKRPTRLCAPPRTTAIGKSTDVAGTAPKKSLARGTATIKERPSDEWESSLMEGASLEPPTVARETRSSSFTPMRSPSDDDPGESGVGHSATALEFFVNPAQSLDVGYLAARHSDARLASIQTDEALRLEEEVDETALASRRHSEVVIAGSDSDYLGSDGASSTVMRNMSLAWIGPSPANVHRHLEYFSYTVVLIGLVDLLFASIAVAVATRDAEYGGDGCFKLHSVISLILGLLVFLQGITICLTFEWWNRSVLEASSLASNSSGSPGSPGSPGSWSGGDVEGRGGGSSPSGPAKAESEAPSRRRRTKGCGWLGYAFMLLVEIMGIVNIIMRRQVADNHTKGTCGDRYFNDDKGTDNAFFFTELGDYATVIATLGFFLFTVWTFYGRRCSRRKESKRKELPRLSDNSPKAAREISEISSLRASSEFTISLSPPTDRRGYLVAHDPELPHPLSRLNSLSSMMDGDVDLEEGHGRHTLPHVMGRGVGVRDTVCSVEVSKDCVKVKRLRLVRGPLSEKHWTDEDEGSAEGGGGGGKSNSETWRLFANCDSCPGTRPELIEEVECFESDDSLEFDPP